VPPVTTLGAVAFDGIEPCSIHAAVIAIREKNNVRAKNLIAYLLSDELTTWVTG
jgi:hypothetical protein